MDAAEVKEIKAPPKHKLVPLNGYVLFTKDEDKKTTKAGLILPDSAAIPVLTGRVVEIAKDVRDNPHFLYLRKLDKVIVNYHGAVPVELDPANKIYCIPATSILGVWKDPDDLGGYEEEE